MRTTRTQQGTEDPRDKKKEVATKTFFSNSAYQKIAELRRKNYTQIFVYSNTAGQRKIDLDSRDRKNK